MRNIRRAGTVLPENRAEVTEEFCRVSYLITDLILQQRTFIYSKALCSTFFP